MEISLIKEAILELREHKIMNSFDVGTYSIEDIELIDKALVDLDQGVGEHEFLNLHHTVLYKCWRFYKSMVNARRSKPLLMEEQQSMQKTLKAIVDLFEKKVNFDIEEITSRRVFFSKSEAREFYCNIKIDKNILGDRAAIINFYDEINCKLFNLGFPNLIAFYISYGHRIGVNVDVLLDTLHGQKEVDLRDSAKIKLKLYRSSFTYALKIDKRKD